MEYTLSGFVVRTGLWGCSAVQGSPNDTGSRTSGAGDTPQLVKEAEITLPPSCECLRAVPASAVLCAYACNKDALC